MHFLLDTNVLIPLEDSAIPLRDSLVNFVRLANANKHVLVTEVDSIVARVKRRTVYSLSEIEKMAAKPTKVILFRFVRHLSRPLLLNELLARGILSGAPQSITKIPHEKFKDVVHL